MKFTDAVEAEARIKEGESIILYSSRFNVELKLGDAVRFVRIGFNRHEAGKVLAVDLTAEYPIKIEWYAPEGKRITSFRADSFKTFKVEPDLNTAMRIAEHHNSYL